MQAVQNAGGTVSGSRQCIKAAYSEQNAGIWLDILMLMETAAAVLEEEKSELYGYAFLVSKDAFDKPENLCRSLALGPQDGGIFLDQGARDALKPYIICEQIKKWPSGKPNAPLEKQDTENLVRMKEFRNLSVETKQKNPLCETIFKNLEQGPKQNTLIIGPAFSGKREGIYRFCREVLDDFPPLIIRFGSGGLNALTDSWSCKIQKLAESAAGEIRDSVAEINKLWKFLFQQRLREEIPPYMLQNGRHFFSLLLEMYIDIAEQNRARPVFVLENIHKAEKLSVQIFMDAINLAAGQREALILGVCNREIQDKSLKNWEKIFKRVIKFPGENTNFPSLQMPQELWEIAYALSLFNRCFPPDMFLQLITEEGKNPAMILRALSILYAQGIIDSIQFPRLRIKNFSLRAEAVLGEKKELIREIVRKRLLFMLQHGNLGHCFNLLAILSELNGGSCTDDELILKSLYADMVNGTVQEIEKAIHTDLLQTIAGAQRAGAVKYIYQTMQALLNGGEKEIRLAFNSAAPDCSSFPVLKAQTLANFCAYQLSIRNVKPALDAVKETILQSQVKNSYSLAQSYRLFSLVNLSRQQAGETNEYLNFAMENAEKSGNGNELGISAYYAAASQFLFGNISRAIRLAQKAREQALSTGLPGWADRARFLEGRLAFELGSYSESFEIFGALRKKQSGRDSVEKERLLAAWEYRAKVFYQNPLTPKPENSGYDADLFEMEAAYLAGNFRKTVELAEALAKHNDDGNFIFTEQPDWRSGFAQVELLYFSQGEIWKRMICAYHSLALCRISAEAGKEALQNMRHILRDEQLSEMDPWDAFYFYAWYLILEHSGAGQIDKNTAVSMAFKRLQRRASRIDEVQTRRQFLSRPRWNSELSLAAKEYRLI